LTLISILATRAPAPANYVEVALSVPRNAYRKANGPQPRPHPRLVIPNGRISARRNLLSLLPPSSPETRPAAKRRKNAAQSLP